MQLQKKQCFLSEADKNELRKILKENFPEKTDLEVNVMFQKLMDSGGKEGYVKKINGKITKIGVITEYGKIIYFCPDINSDFPWMYKD